MLSDTLNAVGRIYVPRYTAGSCGRNLFATDIPEIGLYFRRSFTRSI